MMERLGQTEEDYGPDVPGSPFSSRTVIDRAPRAVFHLESHRTGTFLTLKRHLEPRGGAVISTHRQVSDAMMS